LYWIPRSLPFLNIGASVYDPVFSCAPFTAFQAGIGKRMLARLTDITEARRQVAQDLRARLSSNDGVNFIEQRPDAEPVYLRLPMLVGVGRPVREAPVLGMVRSYPAPINAIKALQPHLVKGTEKFPGAEILASRILTLPTHRFVSLKDRDRIAAALAGKGAL
jgi:dTDP-4-amino-4,6-dideoxygalactose transaminase